jgi:hypothetical protein
MPLRKLNMSRRTKIIAVAVAAGAIPLLVALLQLVFVQWPVKLFVDNVIFYTLDGYVSFFDHTSFTAASGNVLAITTGTVGAAILSANLHLGSIIRTLATACAACFAMACLSSNLGVRFDYVLTLLAVQVIVAIGLISISRRITFRLKHLTNYSIADLIALTVVVAFGIVSLGSLQSAVVLETSIIYWVFLLGAIVGCLSFLSRTSMYVNLPICVFAVFTFIGLAVILATSAFRSLEALRIPNLHYDVEAGAFDGFWHGYFHWFAMHFVMQVLATFGIAKLVKLWTNRNASTGLPSTVAA